MEHWHASLVDKDLILKIDDNLIKIKDKKYFGCYQVNGVILHNVRLFFCLLFILPCQPVAADEHGFGAKWDFSSRADKRTERDSRAQYRLRFYPQYQFDDNWSVHAFAVTGNAFSSSYNTVDDGNSDHFYLRRLYLRYQQGEGKTEVGVIPTYKGDVASTGLSQHGWITGLRHVLPLSDGRLELVAGELAHVDDPNAFQAFENFNYFEMEYSGRLSPRTGYEISLERMTGSNYVRGELRHRTDKDTIYAVEVIDKLDSNRLKVLVSLGKNLDLWGQKTQLFAHVSHTDEDLGLRAELTEDFLDTGYALAAELKGKFSPKSALSWFAKIERYQESKTNRLQLGLQYKFSNL
ncbi:hypothetical protein P2G88_00460 [Aliiglaciecola sp. CAU 1673]|uniref:hypothetical protein n=1 Tax=Aliiglaciecola sp. CAU 1673 TaxID=3032595 RepID=UPI0023DC0249|nr:hypothetical protein [Aliiglaciecola sp. CAU 1673]MDF2176719.1 hypothetical protein [Aliiglaciecola sp. CAU 1673]